MQWQLCNYSLVNFRQSTTLQTVNTCSPDNYRIVNHTKEEGHVAVPVDSPEKLKDEASENFVLSNKENQIILKAGLGLNPGLHLNTEAPSSWKVVLEERTLNGRVTEEQSCNEHFFQI